MTEIAANLQHLREHVASVASKCGRGIGEVSILAVSKTFPSGAVDEAAQAGQRLFGENRVQEAESKMPAVAARALQWHLIGHLQSNKARRAVQLFDVIESIDSEKIARAIDGHAIQLGKVVPIYLEINIGSEPQKHGLSPQDAVRLAGILPGLPGLNLVGLMAIPPYSENPEDSRPYFVDLHRLLDRVNRELDTHVSGLSMGMSHDWPVAVQEGATLLRVGTAIFGSRTS